MNKHLVSIKNDGFGVAFRNFLSSKLVKMGWVEDAERMRQRLSREFDEMFNSTIAYGALKGFQFSPNTWWSKHDRASMIFGLYEKEIVNMLQDLSKTKNVFIDVGAADGYYGVATVSQKIFEKSYCFEIEAQGRAVIKENANLNGVSNKVTIFEEAKLTSLAKIPAEDIKNSVALIDIEGFEFDFLDDTVLEILKNTVCIIELHDWFYDDGDQRLADLKRRAAKYFDVSEFKSTSRDTSHIFELERYSDNERWLVCGEGRPRSMVWLRLDPKGRP
ncbi:hypothetical protein [Pseudophaeobacter sp. TrK17]|uniref:hypothetical protein n=1 Tax=Pseudophaeobacter sp. TrK17 TaxID=2815167 RepID=UPI0035D132FA